MRLLVKAIIREGELTPSLVPVYLLLEEGVSLGSIVAVTASIGITVENDFGRAFIEARKVLQGLVGSSKRSSMSNERHGAVVLRVLEAHAPTVQQADRDHDTTAAWKAAAAAAGLLEALVGLRPSDASVDGPHITTAPRYMKSGKRRRSPLFWVTLRALRVEGIEGRPRRGHRKDCKYGKLPEGRTPNDVRRDLFVALGLAQEAEKESFVKFLNRCRKVHVSEVVGSTAPAHR